METLLLRIVESEYRNARGNTNRKLATNKREMSRRLGATRPRPDYLRHGVNAPYHQLADICEAV